MKTKYVNFEETASIIHILNLNLKLSQFCIKSQNRTLIFLPINMMFVQWCFIIIFISTYRFSNKYFFNKIFSFFLNVSGFNATMMFLPNVLKYGDMKGDLIYKLIL